MAELAVNYVASIDCDNEFAVIVTDIMTFYQEKLVRKELSLALRSLGKLSPSR